MLCVPAFALSPVGRLALDPMSADRHTCGPIPKRTFAPAWRDEGASCEAFNCSAACLANRSSLFLGAAVTEPIAPGKSAPIRCGAAPWAPALENHLHDLGRKPRCLGLHADVNRKSNRARISRAGRRKPKEFSRNS